ncbi:hypothetical protein EBZ80_02130 [bacterium]|nr:hypothetical protein [bacterium]
MTQTGLVDHIYRYIEQRDNRLRLQPTDPSQAIRHQMRRDRWLQDRLILQSLFPRGKAVEPEYLRFLIHQAVVFDPLQHPRQKNPRQPENLIRIASRLSAPTLNGLQKTLSDYATHGKKSILKK